MDTLDGTEWDVVLSSTGLVTSLLALALSRTGKRILHLDRNDYYGGSEAALSLEEAEAWATKRSLIDNTTLCSCAKVWKREEDEFEDGKNKLSPSRAYSLALAPQLIYARSSLLDALVSSRAHNQLDFQAVGSWFIVDPSTQLPTLTRIPSGREDVFQDTSLDLKAKRALMKFLRFVGNYEEQAGVWEASKDAPFSTFLQQKFALPEASHGLLTSLTLSPEPSRSTTTQYALPRMARYLRSIGILGAGFGAVLPKWGGLAEIAQVSCRTCAVGGGVYVLNKSIKESERANEVGVISAVLADGEKISTTWLCTTEDELPTAATDSHNAMLNTATFSRSISIVSSPLPFLFPPTSEGGVTPAGAVVAVQSTNTEEPSVHLFVHTADAGECPMTQSVIYASTALPANSGFSHLDRAVSALLDSVGEQPTPEVLWKLEYQQQIPNSSKVTVVEQGIILLPALPQSLALDDSLMDQVKSAWTTITGDPEESFMKFDRRDGMEDEESFS